MQLNWRREESGTSAVRALLNTAEGQAFIQSIIGSVADTYPLWWIQPDTVSTIPSPSMWTIASEFRLDGEIIIEEQAVLAVIDGVEAHAGLLRGYLTNVSNAIGPENSTVAATDVDTTLPLNGNGANNVEWTSVTEGKLKFDDTFNSNNGGIIIDQLDPQTEITFRVSVTQLTAGQSIAVIKVALVPDKTLPTSNLILIESGELTFKQNTRHHVELSAFRGTAQAIYIQIHNTSPSHNYQLDGAKFMAVEKIPSLN
jgi:hypothetical protein